MGRPSEAPKGFKGKSSAEKGKKGVVQKGKGRKGKAGQNRPSESESESSVTRRTGYADQVARARGANGVSTWCPCTHTYSRSLFSDLE